MARSVLDRNAHVRRVAARGVFALGAAALTLASTAYGAGVRLNLSGSIPPGFYRRTHTPITRGSLVLACLPPDVAALARERAYVPPGSCKDGNAPIGKMVVAMPSDTVDVTETGVFVDGRLISNSAPLETDSRGRRLPSLHVTRRVVAPGEVWLLSSYSARSFDSRYFGAVSAATIIANLKPLAIAE